MRADRCKIPDGEKFPLTARRNVQRIDITGRFDLTHEAGIDKLLRPRGSGRRECAPKAW